MLPCMYMPREKCITTNYLEFCILKSWDPKNPCCRAALISGYRRPHSVGYGLWWGMGGKIDPCWGLVGELWDRKWTCIFLGHIFVRIWFHQGARDSGASPEFVQQWTLWLPLGRQLIDCGCWGHGGQGMPYAMRPWASDRACPVSQLWVGLIHVRNRKLGFMELREVQVWAKADVVPVWLT